MYYNKTMFAGRLGADPELRFTASGREVVSFRVACNEKTGDNEITTWMNCVAFGKIGAIIAEHLKKGEPVFIEGRLRENKWEDNGVTRYKTELHVDSFRFLGGGKKTE